MENNKELEQIKKMNIYEKINAITYELGVVEKNLKINISKTNSYNAVSERDILDSVKPLENKYRVCSFPLNRGIEESDVLEKQTDYGTTKSLYMRIKTTYRFMNIDNPEEYIDTTAYSDGIDTGDKATGKAMTYGDKYALMKMYKISTGDDPDKEASPQTGYTKKTATIKEEPKVTKKPQETAKNYRNELVNYCSDNNIDMGALAREHKLNTKTKNEEFKKVLDILKGGK